MVKFNIFKIIADLTDNNKKDDISDEKLERGGLHENIENERLDKELFETKELDNLLIMKERLDREFIKIKRLEKENSTHSLRNDISKYDNFSIDFRPYTWVEFDDNLGYELLSKIEYNIYKKNYDSASKLCDNYCNVIGKDESVRLYYSILEMIKSNKICKETLDGYVSSINNIKRPIYEKIENERLDKELLEKERLEKIKLKKEKTKLEKEKSDRSKIVLPIIENYLSGKDIQFLDAILNLSNNYKDYPSIYAINNQSESIICIEELINDYMKDRKKSRSFEEIKSIDSIISLYNKQIQFLKDSNKLLKLIEKKGVELSYQKLFFEISKKSEFIRIECLRDLFKDSVKQWKEELGEKTSIYDIIKKVCEEEFESPDYPEIKYNIWCFLFVLKEFGYHDPNKNEVENLAASIRENIELEEFEKNLGKPEENTGENFQMDHLDLNGYEFEDLIANYFRISGYEVIQTPKSGDQGADLIISDGSMKTVVQVKKYSGGVSNSAVQQVVAAKSLYEADEAMVITNSFYTPSAVELAYVNDVELIDGEKLEEMFLELDMETSEDDDSNDDETIPFSEIPDHSKIEVFTDHFLEKLEEINYFATDKQENKKYLINKIIHLKNPLEENTDFAEFLSNKKFMISIISSLLIKLGIDFEFDEINELYDVCIDKFSKNMAGIFVKSDSDSDSDISIFDFCGPICDNKSRIEYDRKENNISYTCTQCKTEYEVSREHITNSNK